MSSYRTKQTPGDTGWFIHDRFGMFIHLGLYSMPGRHEWIKLFEEISDEKYDLYFKYFNPDKYEPRKMAKLAKKAGMKYAILTAKHHEGFCMFDSKYTDYKCTNTPAKRDLCREFVEAFRAEGLRVGFYYSLIDWHHSEFEIDVLHPLRRKEEAQEWNKKRDMKKYNEYVRNQVVELLTNYGDIDIMWFDFSYTEDRYIPDYFGERWQKGKNQDDWEAEKLIKTVRNINPDIIINNRTGINQDVWTPEQYQPNSWIRDKETDELVVWEACQTFSGSWGYYRDEMSWKSNEMLIKMLIKTVSCGGNFLMNVGPTSRGTLDNRAAQALNGFAEWMEYHSDAIYGCTMAEPEFVAPNGCVYTQSTDGKRLYVHLFDYPFQFVQLEGLAGKVEYAQFLFDRSEILFSENSVYRMGDQNEIKEGTLILNIPTQKPPVEVPVIELFLK